MHGLNPPQAAAVLHIEGPLLVLAGAGSGKTRVIVEKIAHLIGCGRYPARRIAAITFTNKSAKEMRERVAKRLREQDADEVTICTFHALGLKFLQIEHAAVGLKRGFSIFDADDAAAQIKDLMYGAKPDDIEDMKNLVSRAKNAGLSPEQAMAAARSNREKEAASVYERYQLRLTAFNAVDFDDLIRLPVQILEENPEIALAWRERIGYLLVDECQDTNDAQYRLLKQLAGEKGNFTCVGDDDQSIYAWRGANPENLQQMGRDYPALEIIKLEQNYRCSNRVLRAANALIANNPHEHLKKLWSDQADGERIRVWECRNSEHEAEKVAAEIAFVAQSRNVPWSDFCILFRGNFQSRPLEKAMQLLRIPYHLTGGTMFLERQEVKDTLAWLRLLVNPDDDTAFMRGAVAQARCRCRHAGQAGRTGAGKGHADGAGRRGDRRPAAAAAARGQQPGALHRHPARPACADRQVSSGDMIRKVAKESGLLSELRQQAKEEASYQRRANNIEELAQWFEGGPRGATAADLAGQLALLSRSDKDEGGNQVRMMTMHASKGLEFPYVFIVGCEDGVLPHQVSLDEGNLQEERRLLYVGITRAKIQLWMSYSKLTRKFGEHVRLKPSRFFEEIPAEEIQRDGADPVADAARKKERASGVGGDRGVVRLIGERRSPRWRRSQCIVVGRAGGLAGTRRKPIHGGSAAASMPRTVPPSPPARPLTGSVRASHGKEKENQKQQPGLRQNRGFGWRSACASDRKRTPAPACIEPDRDAAPMLALLNDPGFCASSATATCAARNRRVSTSRCACCTAMLNGFACMPSSACPMARLAGQCRAGAA
jgi:ATP-dependent DNA helicase Rep